MKHYLLGILCCWVCLKVQAQSGLLQKELTLSADIKPVEMHLRDIRSQGINLAYVVNHLDAERPIRLVKETETLENLLNDILREQPVRIIEQDRIVLITRLKVIPPPPAPPPKKGKNFVVLNMPL